MFKRPKKLANSRTGTACVEMAIVAPVVFLLIFGSIELGRVMMVRQALTNAAREGCREACLITTQSSQRAETAVREALAGVIADARNNDKLTISFSPAPSEATKSGTAIETTVEIAVADISWLPPFFTAGANVQCSSTMNRE